MEIGIIGFGQFGQFFAKYLTQKQKVLVSDKIDKRKAATEIGIKFVDISEATSKDIIILAVPISELKNSLVEIKDSIKKGAIVMDVCSVKTIPCSLMKETLPQAEIIGTHPLFGPQSGRHGIKGMKIVICPVRCSAPSLEKIRSIFHSFGLEIIETTPEEHDRAMAVSQALMHFIAKAMIKIGIQNQEIKISALDKALDLIDIFKEDSEQLFRDVQSFNPFSKEIRGQFLKELEKINNELTR